MKNFKLKSVLLLMLFGCAIGLFTNIATNLVSLNTNTVEAATRRLSQAQQIAQVNAKLSSSNKNAKNWIAYRESGYSYTARNGKCYGRYQLLKSYLHGDLSPVNQEKRANTYVSSRYGSWVKAKQFWQRHHWY
ncbi:hypothetical protein [Lactiplantibacillus herbarum]|uniref:aggregation-promoting factor C-terminal-like domain-containing protein n=1 Tax=Lactiplantibacillus herbarum TaxID=1670446 RepID=UPI00064F1AF3|nr:hypothetical protein [Lactiplantibacillus herbarum]